MTDIKISVVIGTYNQKDKLRITLESLFNQTLSKDLYEIIVVDSLSTDGTEEMAKSFASRPDVASGHPALLKYIGQENQGRPGARNRGIKEAQGDIIFLTDADMRADKNLLQEHLNAHQKIKNAVFEGITYNLKFEIRNSKFEINPNIQIPKSQIEPYIKECLKPFQKIRWSYFLTGNLSIPKSIIVNAGMFDQDFAGYGWEDIELGYRLNKKHVPLYYLPSAINYHMHPVSQEEMFQRKYQMGKSAAIFYRKHRNLEIKYFLGMNPIAQGIYALLKRFPVLQNFIKNNNYLREEFLYRKGLDENI